MAKSNDAIPKSSRIKLSADELSEVRDSVQSNNRLLWQRKENADDSLTIGLWNIHNKYVSQNTRWRTVRAFLEEYCVDIMFLQEVKAGAEYAEKMLSIDLRGRYYEYVGVTNEAGIYYDSSKLEMKMIDSLDYGVSVPKNASGVSIDLAEMLRMREYTVLFTRKYTDYEHQQNIIGCIPYSFLAMSYHAVSNAKEDAKSRLMEAFFNYAVQLQNKVSIGNASPYPIIIGMDGNLDLNEIKLPTDWIQTPYEGNRRNITSEKKDQKIIDYFIYNGRKTSTKMWVGSISCINIGDPASNTKRVFNELEPEEDIESLSNHDPIVAYCAFKHVAPLKQTKKADQWRLSDVEYSITVMLFCVNCEDLSLIDLESTLVQLTMCATNDELNITLSQLDHQLNFMIVSSEQPSADLLSHHRLLRYYRIAVSEVLVPKCLNDLRVTCLDTIDDLTGELYHDLGEHYRQEAQRVMVSKQDRIEAKYLLSKANRCYAKLEHEIEKMCSEYENTSMS